MFSAPGGASYPTLPETYSMTFDADGTLSISTDCNQYKAEVALGENQSFSITPTISTLAACPAGSKAEDFLGWLSAAQTLQFDSDGMVVLTAVDSGVVGMLFAASE